MAEPVIRGMAELKETLAKLGPGGLRAAAKALYQEALIESKESQRRTPVDTGALRASHVVTRPTIEGQDATVSIQVGGPAAPYAITVHERLDVDHPVGQAKFLESVINESRPYMAERILKRLDPPQEWPGIVP